MPGGVSGLATNGGFAVVTPPRVAPTDDPGVAAAVDPAPQLGGADHGERVGAGLEEEQLEDAVAHVGRAEVLVSLALEGGDIEVTEATAAGQLHVDALSDGRVLHGEEAGPVAGQLGLARPLVQGGEDGPQPEGANRQPRQGPGEAHELEQHGRVEGMAGQHVAELVAEDEAQLLGVGQVDESAGHHDDGLVDADGHGVVRRLGEDVELREVLDVEGRRSLDVGLVHPGELPVVDAHGGAQVHQAQRPLVPQPRQLAQDEVEALHLAEGDQRSLVGRVLPGQRADVRQADRRLPSRLDHGPAVIRHSTGL